MTRTDKRLRRLQEHDRWLKWTGRRCCGCGGGLGDDEEYGGDDPRQPRVCANCCGSEIVVDVPPGHEPRPAWFEGSS
jgi:hypothetical protein